jgi:hypothetical protein
VSQTERSEHTLEERFSLFVDQYGRLWLNAKLEGLPVEIDLGEKDVAFGIMAETMSEHEFEYRPVHGHEAADNDE